MATIIEVLSRLNFIINLNRLDAGGVHRNNRGLLEPA